MSLDQRAILSESLILGAIEAGQPKMVYQPIVDLRDRRLIGIEALARFRIEPSCPPDVWFESAHRVGHGVTLELVALRRAAAAARSLPPDLYMAVNVSPGTIVASDVALALEGAPLAQVVLEITEHAPVDDYGPLLAAIERLREFGMRIAIDDVGAGYSTLRHVLRLDPEIIKLDQEVTLGVESDMSRAKLVGGLIAGASAVSALVVAEGIETEAQLARLLDLGIRGGQGYLLGRPVELEEAIATGNATAASLEPFATATLPLDRRRPALEGARILVVDDSVAHRSLIRTIFELEGARVHDTATAAAAVQAIEAIGADIVLLDVRLPDGDGFEVLGRIRRQHPGIPVVIVSGAAAVSDRVTGLDGGADDYVLKPFSPDELVARVDSILRR